MNCRGPCGRSDLTENDFSSNGRGGKRDVCKRCYNNGRRKTNRRSPGQGRSFRAAAPQKWPSVAAFDAEPKTTAYCAVCGESPESATHYVVDGHAYVTPALKPAPAPKIEVVEEKLTRVEEHRLKRRIKDLEAECAELTAQLSDGGEYHEVVQEVLARQDKTPPSIAPRERTSHLAECTPLVLASDWHIEEEVRPEQVENRNRYDLDIARHRAERFFEATRWGFNHQRQVFKIRDAILWGGGDFITNFLHEDNVETNQLHPTEAILEAQSLWTTGIDFLLEDPEIEQYVIPWNDGNHGRLTKKMRSATRTQNSLEVFLGAQLARHYANEPRVKFILPTSSFTYLPDVYGRTIRFLHGDVFKYHGGVGGITVPLFRSLARWETVKHADLTCMGHWHQRICLPQLMVNGSLIGFNSYAMDIGAEFQAPMQSMRILEPKRWCSSDVPLWVSELIDDQAYVQR